MAGGMDPIEARKLILRGTEACELVTALGDPDRKQVLNSLDLVRMQRISYSILGKACCLYWTSC